MTTILPFLKNDAVFEPEATQATQAMSAAFEAACQALKLSGDAARERELLDVRGQALAERDPVRLSQSVLRDAGAG